MIQEQQVVFDELKERITSVISLYESCKFEKDKLLEENERLKKDKIELEKKIEDLDSKYNTLKIAKGVSSKYDNHDAKIKINSIVREIDKCIALLNKE